MKNAYIVEFKHGLVGGSMVVASDSDEAKREAVALARFSTACIPEGYKADDIVKSVKPAGEVPAGGWGYVHRPTVQLKDDENFWSMTAKEAIALMHAPDFSNVTAAEAAV